MALLFCDSFDHYTNLADKYDTAAGSEMTVTTEAGREAGGSGLQVSASPYFGSYITKVFNSASTVTLGMAVSVSNGDDPISLLWFSSNSTVEMYFMLQPNGLIEVVTYTGSEGLARTIGTTSAAIPFNGSWSYVEFQVTVSSTAGAIIIRINGLPVLSLTGINTTSDGVAAYFNNFSLGALVSYSASVAYNIDDLYICDNTGDFNTSFIGDVHVVALLPTGAGESTQWTPNGAGADWECVDDNPPNSGTTYISSSTVGAKDMYTLGSLPLPGSVHGIMVSSLAAKDQAGTRTLTHQVKDTVSGNEIASSQIAPGTGYHYLMTPFDSDPSGNAWSYAEVNAMQAGVEVAS